MSFWSIVLMDLEQHQLWCCRNNTNTALSDEHRRAVFSVVLYYATGRGGMMIKRPPAGFKWLKKFVSRLGGVGHSLTCTPQGAGCVSPQFFSLTNYQLPQEAHPLLNISSLTKTAEDAIDFLQIMAPRKWKYSGEPHRVMGAGGAWVFL